MTTPGGGAGAGAGASTFAGISDPLAQLPPQPPPPHDARTSKAADEPSEVSLLMKDRPTNIGSDRDMVGESPDLSAAIGVKRKRINADDLAQQCFESCIAVKASIRN